MVQNCAIGAHTGSSGITETRKNGGVLVKLFSCRLAEKRVRSSSRKKHGRLSSRSSSIVARKARALVNPSDSLTVRTRRGGVCRIGKRNQIVE